MPPGSRMAGPHVVPKRIQTHMASKYSTEVKVPLFSKQKVIRGRITARFGLLALSSACMLVQGCFGTATLRTKTETFEHPLVDETRGLYSVQKKPSGKSSNPAYTAGWLRKHWGEPTNIKANNSNPTEELWTYEFTTLKNGVVPMFIIPVPLIAANGKEKVVFLLRNHTLVSAQIVHQETTENVVGYYWGNACGPSWGSYHRNY